MTRAAVVGSAHRPIRPALVRDEVRPAADAGGGNGTIQGVSARRKHAQLPGRRSGPRQTRKEEQEHNAAHSLDIAGDPPGVVRPRRRRRLPVHLREIPGRLARRERPVIVRLRLRSGARTHAETHNQLRQGHNALPPRHEAPPVEKQKAETRKQRRRAAARARAPGSSRQPRRRPTAP